MGIGGETSSVVHTADGFHPLISSPEIGQQERGPALLSPDAGGPDDGNELLEVAAFLGHPQSAGAGEEHGEGAQLEGGHDPEYGGGIPGQGPLPHHGPVQV